MLNLKLREKITVPEYRLMYDTKMRLTSHNWRTELRNYIKDLRSKFNSSDKPKDPFVEKLARYPKPGDWAKAKLKELDKIIYEDNKPIPKGFLGELRSIEFELVFNNAKKIEEFAKEMRKRGLAKCITIKDDHSLRKDEGDEVGVLKEVVVTYKKGDERVIHEVCASLKGKAYVNNSCGTHVHFDMRNVDEKTVKQYGRRLARCVPALRSLLPKARRSNKHCIKPINDINSSTGARESRYTFVNLEAYSKYKTIEIRGHSATLVSAKILSWVKLCEKIMENRIRTKEDEVVDAAELIKLFKLDAELAAYVMERYNKFNPTRVFPAYEGSPVEIKPAPETPPVVAPAAGVVVQPAVIGAVVWGEAQEIQPAPAGFFDPGF